MDLQPAFISRLDSHMVSKVINKSTGKAFCEAISCQGAGGALHPYRARQSAVW